MRYYLLGGEGKRECKSCSKTFLRLLYTRRMVREPLGKTHRAKAGRDGIDEQTGENAFPINFMDGFDHAPPIVFESRTVGEDHSSFDRF